MSETYYIIKEVVKRECIEHYKREARKGKLKWLSLVGALFSIITFLFYIGENKVFTIISMIITVACFATIIVIENRTKKNSEIVSPKNLIEKIAENLNDLDYCSIKIIDELQEEISVRIEERTKEIDRFYRRIKRIFGSLFWLPFCSLTAFLFYQGSVTLTWENYISISANLLAITLTLISILFSIGNIFDTALNMESSSLKFVSRYLHDVKYLLLNNDEKKEKSSLDESN